MNDLFIERFKEMLIADRNLASNTVEGYIRDIKKFLQYSEGELSQNIAEYIEFLKTQEAKQSSIFRNISSLRQFFSFLVDEGVLDKNPTTNIRLKKKNIPLPKVLSEEEISKLLTVFEAKHNKNAVRLKCMLHILYASGLRVSELINLTIDSIILDEDSGKCFLRILGKGNKERMVPLHEIALHSIKEYLNIRPTFIRSANNFLFPSSSKSGHMTRQGFAKLLKNIASEVGISGNKISPHVIRHAFATHLLNHGVDLISLQKLLGHSNISTTQIYTHVSNSKMKDLVEKYSNIQKLNIIKKNESRNNFPDS